MTEAGRVRVAVFGGLRLTSPVASLGGPQERALLARLILERGTPVSVDALIEALWSGSPPPTAAKIVQVYVGHLRRRLGSDAIATVASGYRLERAVIDLDLDELEALLDEGRRRRAAGDLPGAEACHVSADVLARGEPYADVADRPFLAAEVARLEELLWRAREERFEIALERGAGSELVGPLAAAVHARPLRERLRAQLMLALYRAGRQAEALEVYLETRRVLDAELGVDPGPVLEELQGRILRHDPALLAGHVGERPPAAANLAAPDPVGRGRAGWAAVVVALVLVGVAVVPRVGRLTAGVVRSGSPSAPVDPSPGGGGSPSPVPGWTLLPPDAALAGARVHGLGDASEGYLMVGAQGNQGPPAVWYTLESGAAAGSWRPGARGEAFVGAALSDTASSSVVRSDVLVGRACPAGSDRCSAASWWSTDPAATGWMRGALQPVASLGSELRGAGPGGLGLVAVGAVDGARGIEGALWTTHDGRAWQRMAITGAGLGPDARDVTEGGPGLVAVGVGPTGDGIVWTSADAKTWEPAPTGATFRGVELVSVTATTDGLLVAGNGPDGIGVWASTDGLDWRRETRLPHLASALARGIASNPPYVVLVADGPDGPLVLTSVQ